MSATEGSPKWKNPSDVMKVRNIKRRTLARRKTIHDPTELSSALLNSRSACHRPVNKRKNPFGCTSDHNKRPNHGNNLKEDPKEFFKALDVVNERENDASICEGGSSHNPHATSDVGDGVRSLANFQDEQKWQTSEGSPKSCAVKLTSTHAVNRNEQLRDTELSELVADQPTMKTNSQHTRVQVHLPLDWSLKVKMRIVSEASLAWCTQLKMSEEARALSQHVQGQQQWHSDADRTSAFHSCCLYWVHPSIPWIKPFPRIVAEQKISNVSIVGSNDEATLALHRDWTDSLTSVFHLLRAGKCPYFYLCTHQFTVLFRAVGVNSQTNINACLTPTTRGLREAFKQDGISFRMPNLEGKKLELTPEIVSADQNTDPEATSEPDHTPGPHRTACSYDVEDDDDLIDNDEGASVWLESMGLDKKSFPSLDPKRVKLQREGFRRVDNRPESLVYVEGADVQAMFNFLLNCRSCTATSGPQAGVPPTILAPTPFKGATLKPNKLKHSVAKQTDASGNIQKGHVIEMSGPILPHHVLNVSHLLRDLQEEDFTLTFNTHEPTASLNLRGTLFQSDSCKEVEASGLHPKAQETLSSLVNLHDNTVYKEVTSTRHGFSFNL